MNPFHSVAWVCGSEEALSEYIANLATWSAK